MKIGENIKFHRKQKGHTQADLALKANISRSYLADIENDRYNPSLDVTQSIAKALDIPVEELFKEETHTKEVAQIEKPIFPTLVPEQFEDPVEARAFVKSFVIFGSDGFDSDRLNDEEIVVFANELLEHMDTMKYKYKK